MSHRRNAALVVRRAPYVAIALAAVALVASGCGSSDDESSASGGESSKKPLVGVITKNNFNPYWVAIAKGATDKAEEAGVELITSTGKTDSDNASQVSAIENMITRQVDTILITPADNKGIVPQVQKARDAGIQVIALDAATEPASAVDAVFATNHVTMGELIGTWAKAKFAGKEARIAMLDADPQAIPGIERHNGFLKGFGITDDDPQISGIANSHATIEGAQTAMENLLQKDPSINLVYTVSEPAGYGAYEALKKAGKTDDVVLVTLDGSCKGLQYVKEGKFAANSQQFPQDMSAKGIDAAVQFAETGEKVTGQVDTGEVLITDDPQEGVDSQTSAEGEARCWGEK